MIAMQYSFTLPADYDMGIIDRRMRERGPGTDGFPHLAFKAYLSARRDEFGGQENLYAPFYLWDQPEGASNFITGPGFQALTQSFGRPGIEQWMVWHVEAAADLCNAKFATAERRPIEPHADLTALRSEETERARQMGRKRDALASISGFEARSWSLIRFMLYADMPLISGDGQIYRVGHMSLPAAVQAVARR